MPLDGNFVVNKMQKINKIISGLYRLTLFDKRWQVLRNVSSAAVAQHDQGTLDYSKEQEQEILGVLNNIQGKQISGLNVGAKKTKNIQEFLKSHGQFLSLSQLLEVQGVGPRGLKRLCDMILKQKNNPGLVQIVQTKPSLKSTSKFTDPPLGEEHIKCIKTVVSLQISHAVVSWAHIDCQKKELLSWSLMPLPPPESKTSIMALYQTALELKRRVPQTADQFVLEDSNWTGVTGSQSSQLLRTQLTVLLVAVLNHLNITAANPFQQHKVVLLKSNLSARLFQQIVGSERVSSLSLMEDLFKGVRRTDRHSEVVVRECLRSEFRNYSSDSERESLSQALLLAMTFVDLVLDCREESLQVINFQNRAGRKKT